RVKLENLSLMLGMGSKIDFLGSRNHEDMPDLFNSAHLAILPSLVEATSVAALEAMACGIPVAASRVGGLPELIGEDIGGLFRPRDSRSLAETVLTLLSRRDFLTLGNNARQRVLKNWTNSHLVERHLEVYESLIKGNS
ncbi:MAG TPA: glycosyltransferase, partial [Gemmatimonadetes bacterium]|nr:glycosyltransferase [Gemmatimonadota bacterium]